MTSTGTHSRRAESRLTLLIRPSSARPDVTVGDFTEAFAGAGALWSSANDLLTFLAANLGYTKTPLSGALAPCWRYAATRVKFPGWAGRRLSPNNGWNRLARRRELRFPDLHGYDPTSRTGVAGAFELNSAGVDDIGRHVPNPNAQVDGGTVVKPSERVVSSIPPRSLNTYAGRYRSPTTNLDGAAGRQPLLIKKPPSRNSKSSLKVIRESNDDFFRRLPTRCSCSTSRKISRRGKPADVPMGVPGASRRRTHRVTRKGLPIVTRALRVLMLGLLANADVAPQLVQGAEREGGSTQHQFKALAGGGNHDDRTWRRTITIREPRPNLTIIMARHYSRIEDEAEKPRLFSRTRQKRVRRLRAVWGPFVGEAGIYEMTGDLITMRAIVPRTRL